MFTGWEFCREKIERQYSETECIRMYVEENVFFTEDIRKQFSEQLHKGQSLKEEAADDWRSE